VPSRAVSEPAGLQHVLVAGGTPSEWSAMSVEVWNERLTMLADQVGGAGASWLTVRPMGPDHVPTAPLIAAGVAVSWPTSVVELGGVSVAVEAEADAHHRMESVLADLSRRGVTAATLDEQVLGAALLHPAPCEPDLVVLLGPEDVLPRSLSWELAYAEVVFIDATWTDVDPIVVKAAIAEYFTRNRRFGGVNS
jgi:undecaprenyl diphosphate synthase